MDLLKYMLQQIDDEEVETCRQVGFPRVPRKFINVRVDNQTVKIEFRQGMIPELYAIYVTFKDGEIISAYIDRPVYGTQELTNTRYLETIRNWFQENGFF